MNDNLEYFENIDKAIEYFSSATREELFSFLKNENDEVLQQIALLKINEVTSVNEAQEITTLLTEHSSETREYCSFLINRLMKKEEFRQYFSGNIILNKFTHSISDVNPKVCRKIIEILPYYTQKEDLFNFVLKNTFILIEELREKNKNKNYQYNTKSFHLYWHIFALGYILTDHLFCNNKKDLLKLLDLLFLFNEYTIREKGAYLIKQIAPFITQNELNLLLNQYSNDENFYVKEIFN